MSRRNAGNVDVFTAKIKARTPCTCGAKRWFNCTCDYDEMVYEASGPEWTLADADIPSPAFVRYVRNQHPTWDLIYTATPAYLDAEYKKALRG